MDFTDGPYYNFKRSQIIAPGVCMLPAPGHTYGNSIVIVEDGDLFYMIHGDISYTDEAIYADKLSIVYDDIHLARSTQNTIREFIRNHPTVYCSTHTPLGYENLEAKRVMDLDNPPETIWPTEDYFVVDEATGKYICSVCGYVYDPAEHDGKKLKQGVDFELDEASYYKPVSSNSIDVIIKGINNYTGEFKYSYQVITKDYDISRAKIGKIAPKVYTGREIVLSGEELEGLVTLNNTPVRVNTVKEYNDADDPDGVLVTYMNNIRSGKATVSFKGVGKYGGVKAAKFNIESKKGEVVK